MFLILRGSYKLIKNRILSTSFYSAHSWAEVMGYPVTPNFIGGDEYLTLRVVGKSDVHGNVILITGKISANKNSNSGELLRSLIIITSGKAGGKGIGSELSTLNGLNERTIKGISHQIQFRSLLAIWIYSSLKLIFL